MHDRKENLTPLRPWPKKDDFENVVASVAQRAFASKTEIPTFWESVLASFRLLARPTMVAAASLAILIWSGALLHPRTAKGPISDITTTDSPMTVMSWAVSGNTSSTMEMLTILEGLDD